MAARRRSATQRSGLAGQATIARSSCWRWPAPRWSRYATWTAGTSSPSSACRGSCRSCSWWSSPRRSCSSERGFGRHIYPGRRQRRRPGGPASACQGPDGAFVTLFDDRGDQHHLRLAVGRPDEHQRRPAVLYAVAAAVIGGTSLFGGRGRAIHGLLGGLVIGAIYNGLYLLGLPVQWQLIATGLVLLAAVSIDSLSRNGAGSGSPARG